MMNWIQPTSSSRFSMLTNARYDALLRANDVLRLARMVMGCAAATVLPCRFDEAAVRFVLRLHPATRAGKSTELAALMENALSSRRSGDWNTLAHEHARMTVEAIWGRLRGMSLAGWHPTIEFSGEERVREGLQAGRGALFWCMRFSSDIVLKQGFHQTGLPLVHLSDAVHGANSGRTLIGATIISPLFRRAEDPYLAERVVIPGGGALGYLQTLRDHLRANHCVSIFGEPTGRQVVEVPFLTGHAKFAVGAPAIAWTENSALFSVHVIRTGPFHYRVVVDEPIHVDRSLPRREFVKVAVAEFAKRQERLVVEHPSDWQGWTLWKAAQN